MWIKLITIKIITIVISPSFLVLGVVFILIFFKRNTNFYQNSFRRGKVCFDATYVKNYESHSYVYPYTLCPHSFVKYKTRESFKIDFQFSAICVRACKCVRMRRSVKKVMASLDTNNTS